MPRDDYFSSPVWDEQYIRDERGVPLTQREWAEGEKWVDPSRTKEKWSHPYTYSEFFIFGNRNIIARDDVHGIYSDRVWQWWVEEKQNTQGYDELWRKHVGTRYELATAATLSAFFTEYNQILWPEKNMGKKAKVVALAEGCNPSNGYPYWIIWYVEA